MSTETALLIGCLVLLVVLLVRQSLLTHQQSKDRLEREIERDGLSGKAEDGHD